MSQLLSSQKTGIAAFANQFLLATGQSFADFLQIEILNKLESTAAGITATADDVNAVASPGNIWVRDTDTSDGSTLDFSWLEFRIGRPSGYVTVDDDTLTLAASSTNFIEVDPTTQDVTSNTSGFTAGSLPLWIVVTGASTIADNNVTHMGALAFAIGVGAITGLYLSTAVKTKELEKSFGTIATGAATYVRRIRVPKRIGSGTLASVSIIAEDALATSDINYVAVGVINKGAAGAGADVLVNIAAAVNSTKTTSGSAIAANTPRELTIALDDVTGGDVLEITVTATGTLAGAVDDFTVHFEFEHTN